MGRQTYSILIGLSCLVVFSTLFLLKKARTPKTKDAYQALEQREDSNISETPPRRSSFLGKNAPQPAKPPIQPAADRSADLASKIDPFNSWVSAWIAEPSIRQQPEVIAEGVRLARNRRAALYELIALDPEAALAAEITPSRRAFLPLQMIQLLGRPVDGHGDLELLGVTPAEGEPAPERPIFRTATIDGESFDAYVTRNRKDEMTRMNLPLSGVAIDDRIAIRDSPVRRITNAEALEAEQEVIPVAMEHHITELPEGEGQPPPYLYGAFIIQPCCEAHASIIESVDPNNWPSAAWGDPDDPNDDPPFGEDLTAASSWTEGTKKVLAMLVDFPDLTGPPQTSGGTVLSATYIADRINNEVHFFYDEASYGKTGLTMTTADVTPVLRLPQNAQTYAEADDSSGIRIAAVAAAEAQGFDMDDYDRIFTVFTNIGTSRYPNSEITYGGLGNIGGKYMWMNGSFGLGLASHELGHTYGVRHASLWDVSSSDPVDPAGTTVEYGDQFDTMGGGLHGHPLHADTFNPKFINQLDWLPDTAVTEVTSGATHRLYRFDHKSANLATTRALKISRNNNVDYWIGYRRKYVGNPIWGDVSEGAYIIWHDKTSNGRTHLIDIDTPGTDAFDASLNVGNTFDDSAAGIEFEVLGAGGSGSGEYIDVAIDFDSRISLQEWSLDVDEQAGNAIVTLERSGSSSGGVSVTWTTINGTATSPADYTASNGTVNWADGDLAAKTISIPLVADGVSEGSENFVVNLTGISGGVLVGATLASIQIVEPGAADSRFLHQWFSNSGSVHQFALQPNGKIAFVGRTGGFGGENVGGVARLLEDGTKDQEFSDQGAGADVIAVRSIARQPDGKLIVVGNFTTIRGMSINRVARLNEDGSFDSSFDPGASTNGRIDRVLVQPDGKILIGGNFSTFNGATRVGVARLLSDGSLDPGFFTAPPAGTNTINVEALALQPDGKLLIGGTIFANWQTIFDGYSSGIWRFNTDGTIDTSFDVGYGAHTAGANNQLQTVFSIAVQPDGKVLACGGFTGFDNADQPYLVRLNTNGSVDSGFRTQLGAGPDNTAWSLLVQNDGRILVGGRFKNFNGNPILYAARVLGNGAFDSTFDASLNEMVPGGTYENWVRNFALQPDGKILIAQEIWGDQQRVIARVFSGLAGLPGVVEFTSASTTRFEGTTATVTARRSGGSTGAVSVSYSTVGGTATEGADYPLTQGILTWADGDTSDKMIAIPLTSDGVFEPVESFTVQLGTPIGGTQIGASAIAQVTIDPIPPATFDPTSKNVDHTAQTYSIAITAIGDWTASEALSWASISPLNGSGNGTITVTVTANPAHASRSGNITIDGQAHALTQEASPFATFLPVSKNVNYTAQTYDIAVTAATSWSASESLNWASISPANGNGNGTITVAVQENPTHSPRSGVITIDGQDHTLNQQAAPLASFNPVTKNIDDNAQSYFIAVAASVGWTATESLSWASISPTSGTGNGTITVTVNANNSFSSRNGTISIDGNAHTLTQDGIPIITTLNPTSRNVDETAQSYPITVTSNGPWTASDNRSWISISPSSGNGNGTVTVTVTDNTAASPREGTVTIGGVAHSLTQAASPRFLNITPESKSVDATAQVYQISVSSNDTWSVGEALSWVSVNPASGSNNGTITVTVSENDSINPRQGTITVGGETHLLTQEGEFFESVQPGASGYLQDFSGGLPGLNDGWAIESTSQGRIFVTGGVLRMDDFSNDAVYSLNEAILQLDLTGLTNAVLEFKHRHSNDEEHLMPASFSGSTMADGVAISEDGIQWHRVVDFSDRSTEWKTYKVNLTKAAGDAGLTLTSNFRVKFQQYGSRPWPTDGFEFDDISLKESNPGDPYVSVGTKPGGPFKHGRITLKNRLPRKAKVFAKIENKSDGDDLFRILGSRSDKLVAIKFIQIGAGNITNAVAGAGQAINLDGYEAIRLKVLVKPKKKDARTVRKMIRISCALDSSGSTDSARVLFIWKKR